MQTGLTKIAKVRIPTTHFRLPSLPTISSLSPENPRIAEAARRPWPKQRTISLSENFPIYKQTDSDKWTYQSLNFKFISDAPLRDHVVREFAALFELTYSYCKSLPFHLERTEDQGSAKLRVLLFEEYSRYLREGGIPDSGGTYLVKRDLILVPFEGLGLKKTQDSYVLDLGRSNQTLMHEAVHMMMRGRLLKDGWFVEGAAEYVATIPMRQNRLLTDRHLDSLIRYITSYGYGNGGGHNLGRTVELAPLHTLMEADYEDFRHLENSYPYSLLVFHYFAHFDQAGDGANLKAYAEALSKGERTSSARKKLLAGRDYQTLEKLMTESWKQHGLTLRFQR